MKNKALLVCILLLAVINIFLFWPGSLYFLNDDLLHIPLTDQGRFFQTNSVRPVHELLVKLDLYLWHKNAYGYHVTALLLHLIVCMQLYDLCVVMQLKWLKIGRPQAKFAGLLAIILFLAYPQSSETLAWIIGRAPILSAVFFMITVRLFFADDFKSTVYLIGAFSFAASLFTYEQTLLLPLALFGLFVSEKDKVKKGEKLRYLALLTAFDIGYIIVRKLVTSEFVGAYEGSNLLSLSLINLAANAFRILFRLVLNPADKDTFVISIGLFLLLACYLIFIVRKVHSNRNAIIFFATFIIVLIAPMISLGLPLNSFESGRYLYLPSIFFIIGISIASASAFYQNRQLRKPLIAVSMFLIAYWLVGKYTAAKHYASASLYSKSMENKVLQHFKNTSDTLYLDTLHVSIYRLPVFRLGFKTGAKWLDNEIDTNKIMVKHYYDNIY